MKKKLTKGPKILVLDIENSPIIGHVWGLFDNNVGLNQIQQDWHLMSFAAKWVGESKVYYFDQSKEKDITNDKKLLQELWKLMDEADILLGQNIKAFDIPKINARFAMHGMKPPSSYRVLDTVKIARRVFKFTSNKLEFLTDKLNKKYKKLKHNKFPGHSLWMECMKGNKAAWLEMRSYNIQDIKSTEELYHILAPWNVTIDMNVYHGGEDNLCQSCGSHKLKKNGYRYTNTGKYQRYVCDDCGAENKGTTNLLSKEKKVSLKK